MRWMTLTPEEATIIRMRFGIDVDREYTFEEIGRQLSMTCEMVGQTEKAALRKLRRPAMIRQLQALTTRSPLS